MLNESTATLVPEDVGAPVGLFGVEPVGNPAFRRRWGIVGMIIGVPSEVKDDEYRVAIRRRGARADVGGPRRPGQKVRGGLRRSATSSLPRRARNSDSVDGLWGGSDMVLKVKEPVAAEYQRLVLRKDQVLFTYLHLAASRESTEALLVAGNTAIAYETVQLADGNSRSSSR